MPISHFKSMETLSCHSNQSGWATAIKTIFLYGLMSWTCTQSFSFIPLMISEEKIFEYFFRKICPLCCHGNQSKSVIWTKFIEDYSRNISVKKSICSETAKIVNFHFSYYKWMETVSCHSNQTSYPIGTKIILFIPPTYRCYVWNMARTGFMASEEMSFENVDDGRLTTTDGRMDDGCLSIL